MALFPYTSLKQFGVNNEFFFNLKKISEKINEQKWTNVLSTNAMSNVHVGTKFHPDCIKNGDLNITKHHTVFKKNTCIWKCKSTFDRSTV